MPASPARFVQGGLVHVIRSREITIADSATAVEIGTIPAGSTILKPLSGVNIDVVFNAATTNVIDIGTSANDDLYATDLAAGTIAFVALDEAVAMTVDEDTTLYATYSQTGTAATTGSAYAVISYVPPSS